MSLLNVKVKMARYVGDQAPQFSTYATLKLQNVKCTTVTVKGANPCWQQDFLFETNDVNTGLLVEVWRRGFLLDYAIGYHMVSLPTVRYSNEVLLTYCSDGGKILLSLRCNCGGGKFCPKSFHGYRHRYRCSVWDGEGDWVSLDAELEMSDGVVTGTRCPTGHYLLIDARFELPFGPYDPPTGWKEILGELDNSNTAPPSASASGDNDEICDIVDYQKKFEILNTFEQDSRSEDVSAQFQYYGQSAGNSEDSDYTSDFNYPICQQQANSSASQFRNLADQLEMSPCSSPDHPNTKSSVGSQHLYDSQRYEERRVPEDDLYYNSRPNNYKDHKRRKNNYKIGTSEWYDEASSTTFLDQEQFPTSSRHSCKKHISKYHQRKTNKNRRSSLERQSTLYRPTYYEEYYDNGDQFEPYDNKQNCEQVIPYGPEKYYNDGPNEEIYNYDNSYSYADQKEEDSQWDGGGVGEYYYSPGSSSDTQQLKTTYPVQQEVDEENEEVYFSPNQSYEDRHYNETPYEVSPPAVPAQRHKQLPEIPAKKTPYMEYYSNSYYNEQVSSTKKILPQIPHSRIKQSPSLPQAYQKIQRRASIDQRSSSLDHKDGEDYTYIETIIKGQFEEYDDGYYNDNVSLQQEKQYTQNNSISLTNANNEYESQRNSMDDKKEETEGFNRRDTFMKFYQRTVKHLENPRSFFQQHNDSAESQEEHKEESFETAVSSVSTSNRRWIQEISSSKTNSYEQYKPKEDISSSVCYTLRQQESTESYQDELLPAEDHNDEPESPRVLPEVPTSTGSVDLFSSPIKHFPPSISQQQQQLQLQQLQQQQQQQQQQQIQQQQLQQQQQDSIEEHEDDDQLDLEEEKELSVEEPRIPEQTAPEEKSNLARMRWHKAYNKIVHQLNLSQVNTIIIDDRRADGIRGFDDDPTMDPPAGGGTGPGSSGGGGGGGFLSNRRIKLTAVFPMIGGTRRTISKSDSSSLAKTGNPERSVANATAAAAAAAKPPVSLPRNRMRRGSSLTDLKRSDSLAGSTGSFGDLMNLKRFYDDSSVGSAENLVARAVPLSTVFCRQHLGAASEESVTAAAEAAASGPYHHRSRIDLQQKQQQQLQQSQQQQQLQLQHNHQQMQQQQQQQTRRYASELGGTRQQPPQHRTPEMTSQQRIERMSRIMKQQNHRPEQMMRFRHTVTLVSARH